MPPALWATDAQIFAMRAIDVLIQAACTIVARILALRVIDAQIQDARTISRPI